MFFQWFGSVRGKILTEPPNFLFKKLREIELFQPSFFYYSTKIVWISCFVQTLFLNCRGARGERVEQGNGFQCKFFQTIFSQTFRMILNTLIGAFDDFLEKYLDGKNLVWFGSARFGSVR